MSTKPKYLDVTIMGRTYKVVCEDEQREDLLAAVAYLDRKMNEIKSAGKVASSERIAIMAALNIAHELLSLRNSGGGSSDFDIEILKRRIALMRTALDEALAPPEPLL